MDLFVFGLFAIFYGTLGTINTILWHIYGNDPEWLDILLRLKEADYQIDLVLNIFLALLGVIVTIGSIIYIRRHRCPDCGKFVTTDQNYCGNCGKRL